MEAIASSTASRRHVEAGGDTAERLPLLHRDDRDGDLRRVAVGCGGLLGHGDHSRVSSATAVLAQASSTMALPSAAAVTTAAVAALLSARGIPPRSGAAGRRRRRRSGNPSGRAAPDGGLGSSPIPRDPWSTERTTPHHHLADTQRVRVSHPSHPRFGQEFRLVSLRRLRDEPLLLVAD
jgi:hypothetical protein